MKKVFSNQKQNQQNMNVKDDEIEDLLLILTIKLHKKEDFH